MISKGSLPLYNIHVDGLVHERCNSSALAMELRLSCTNPSIYLYWCVNFIDVDFQRIMLSVLTFQANGTDHPALFTLSLHTEIPHWIHSTPRELTETGVLGCYFRFQHKHPPLRCYVESNLNGELTVILERPMRAITPGQYAVFYDGDVCLGSARVMTAGPSIYDLNQMDRIELDERFSW